MLSSHGGFITIAIYHHGEPIKFEFTLNPYLLSKS